MHCCIASKRAARMDKDSKYRRDPGYTKASAASATAPRRARGHAAAGSAERAAAPPAPAGPPPVSFDLNDFKGAFSFDDFFNTLAGEFLPSIPADDGLPSSDPSSGPVGFPEAEALLPRFRESRRELLELNRRVDDRLERLRKDVAAQDSEHKETLGKLERGVEGLFDSFGRLDARISGVGQTAARIGDHLQSADAQRETASNIMELIKYLMDFNRSRGESVQFLPLAAVFLDEKEMGRAAAFAMKLRALAEEDEDAREVVPGEGRKGGPSASPGLEVAVDNLHEYCNDLENKLLQKFDAASAKKDLKSMADCAKTLEQFQQGSRAIHRYVTTRPMFMDVEKMRNDIRIATGETGSSIANVIGPVNPTRGLGNLYKQIYDTMEEEQQTVEQVFPNPKAVMAILTQRVLEQRVHNVLIEILKTPNIDNPPPLKQGGLLTYLRTLALSYEKTVDLSKRLQDLGCGDLDIQGTVEGIFAEHKDKYLEVEQRSLMQQFEEKCESEYQQQQAAAGPGLDPASAAAAAAAAGSPGNLVRQRTTPSLLPPGAGGIGVVADCVQWNKDAIERCRVLVPEPALLVESVTVIFNVLLDQMGEYTLSALETASKALAEAAALREKFSIGTAVSRRVAQAAAAAAEQAALAGEQSIRTFFIAVKRATATVSTVQQYFQGTISELLMAVDGAHGKCVEEMTRKLGEAEAVVLRGMQVCIDTSVGEVERLLAAEQKPTEFRPPEDGTLPDHRPTTACIKVKAYLERIVDAAQTALEGPNRHAFLLELGVRLHKALLAHIQRFSFNPGGGLRLKRDVSEYADSIRAFKTPTVDELFESLSSLVNLFIVAPDSLRTLVDSSHLSHKDALIYIQLRDDYKSARIAQQFAR
ncbi:unnamed protein product [Closterium sp. NIES-54]